MVRSRDSPEFTHSPQDIRLRSPPAVCSLFKQRAAFFAFQAKNGHNSIIFHLLRRELAYMSFFTSAIDTLQILVVALGAGLGAWGVINLLEGYGNDNPGANAHVP